MLYAFDMPEPQPSDARSALWRRWADHVEGLPIDAGHLLAEETPEVVLAAITPFLARHGRSGKNFVDGGVAR
jgi:hypothetical protein